MGQGASGVSVAQHAAPTLPPLFGGRVAVALEAGDAAGLEAVLNEVASAQQRTTLLNNMIHKGRTPLQHAAHAGQPDVCAVLLRHGAVASRLSPEPRGGGTTPLHEAAAALAAAPACPRRAERLGAVLGLLLEAGADPCLESGCGLTPMDLLHGRRPEAAAAAAGGSRESNGAAGAGAGGGAAAAHGEAGGGVTGGAGGGVLAALRARLGGRCGGAQAAALRRMEAAAGMFSGAARLQVAPFGSCDWSHVWLAVLPRRVPCPLGAPPREASAELVAFPGGASGRRPLLRACLAGGSLEVAHGAARLLVLPCGRKRLNADFMQPWASRDAAVADAAGASGAAAAQRCGHATTAAAATHWALHVRPVDYSDASAAAFERLLAALRACCAPAADAGAAAGAAAAAAGAGAAAGAAAAARAPPAGGAAADRAGARGAPSSPREGAPRSGAGGGATADERRRAEGVAAAGSQRVRRPDAAGQAGAQQLLLLLPRRLRLTLPPLPSEAPSAAPAGVEACCSAGGRGSASPAGPLAAGGPPGCAAAAPGGGAGPAAAAPAAMALSPPARPPGCVPAAALVGGAEQGGGGGPRCVVCLEAVPVVGFRHGRTVHCCTCYECAQHVLSAHQHQHCHQGRHQHQHQHQHQQHGLRGVAAGGPSGGGNAGEEEEEEAMHMLCPLCRAQVEEVLLVYTP